MSEKNGLQDENLERGLKERHIQLIALSGAIGVGLFLGLETAIQMAGQSLLILYVISDMIMIVLSLKES